MCDYSPKVRIRAFQACDPGSIPGGHIFLLNYLSCYILVSSNFHLNLIIHINISIIASNCLYLKIYTDTITGKKLD